MIQPVTVRADGAAGGAGGRSRWARASISQRRSVRPHRGTHDRRSRAAVAWWYDASIDAALQVGLVRVKQGAPPGAGRAEQVVGTVGGGVAADRLGIQAQLPGDPVGADAGGLELVDLKPPAAGICFAPAGQRRRGGRGRWRVRLWWS